MKDRITRETTKTVYGGLQILSTVRYVIGTVLYGTVRYNTLPYRYRYGTVPYSTSGSHTIILYSAPPLPKLLEVSSRSEMISVALPIFRLVPQNGCRFQGITRRQFLIIAAYFLIVSLWRPIVLPAAWALTPQEGVKSISYSL